MRDGGHKVTEEDAAEISRIMVVDMLPLLQKAAQLVTGARYYVHHLNWLMYHQMFDGVFGLERTQSVRRANLIANWGVDGNAYFKALDGYEYERHTFIWPPGKIGWPR